MFFTNGAHGVSIVKKCLLKNFFHKRPYFGKEAIFSILPSLKMHLWSKADEWQNINWLAAETQKLD